MKIAILTNWPNSKASLRLVAAAKKRGHEAVAVKARDCYLQMGEGKSRIMCGDSDLNHIDAIIPRFTHLATTYGAAIVRQFELNRVFTSTSSQAIVMSADKLYTLQVLVANGVSVPKSAFAWKPKTVGPLVEAVGGSPVVVKDLEGSQGFGVSLAKSVNEAKDVARSLKERKRSFLFQQFIRESGGADIRAVVVGSEVVASMKRQSGGSDFRSNLHLGGTASPIELTAEEREIAIKAAQALNLPVCGVDILRSDHGPLVIELNSAPGFEIEDVTGTDIAAKVIEYVERKYKSH